MVGAVGWHGGQIHVSHFSDGRADVVRLKPRHLRVNLAGVPAGGSGQSSCSTSG